MSTLRLTTLSNLDGSETVPIDTVINGSAKAHVRFNMAGGAITASFNVTSVTDTGSGTATINFTDAVPSGSVALEGDNLRSIAALGAPTSSMTIATKTDAGAASEPSVVSVVVHS